MNIVALDKNEIQQVNGALCHCTCLLKDHGHEDRGVVGHSYVCGEECRNEWESRYYSYLCVPLTIDETIGYRKNEIMYGGQIGSY